MHLRRFVLAPLAEIAPDLKHPSWTGTVAQLLATSDDKSAVKKINGALQAPIH
jgi:2-amino-4-hydroxy-6-hydroxymethyldihydropteridine diphosphokinase